MRLLQPHILWRIAIATLFFVTAACGGSITSIQPTDSLFTTATQVVQPITPLASPTPAISTSSPSPTPTSAPATLTSTSAPPVATKSNLPTATRINFATGATYGLAQGTLQAGQTLNYVARALKDQPMIVMLTTPDQNASLSVFGSNGTVLLPQSQRTTSWQGYLPSTQDYYFRITGGGSTQNFTLTVNIPARIAFSPGENEVTLSGQTVGGYAVVYTAYAFGGQEMEVTVDTSSEVAALTIWGFSDGQPYARAQNGVTDFNMTLPSTQDYIIEVVPQGGNVVDYEVTIRIR